MKSETYTSVLPVLYADTQGQQETDVISTLANANSVLYQESSWPQIISSEPEPLIPCILYQCPLFQVSCEQIQSLISICHPTMTVNTYENISFVAEYNPSAFSLMDSPIMSTSGFSEGCLQEVYTREEISSSTIQELQKEITDSYPIVTNYGAVSILLGHLVRVDISPEKAIYMSVTPVEGVVAVSADGSKSCIIHPNGRVFHDRDEVHMATLNRKAKICKRGVVFTSTDHCLSYLVDESGTKTTAERFRDLSQDFSFQVFYNESQLNESIQKCFDMVDKATHKKYKNGDEIWMIDDYRIKQDQWGDVKITHVKDPRVIKASPTNGQLSVKTRMADMNVGRYPNNYLLVRKKSKVVSASVKGFNAQCGTQRAGFNSTGKVVLH